MAFPARQPRNAGRFDSALGDAALLRIVAEVLRIARPDRPQSTTQRQFDRAREDEEAPEGCPSASAVYQRFAGRVSWGQIKALALSGKSDFNRDLGTVDRQPAARHLTERHVFFALRRVAMHLQVEVLSRVEYMNGRAALIARDVRRNGKDAPLSELLPNADQIVRVLRAERKEDLAASPLDPWDYALSLVGLSPPPVGPSALPVREVTGWSVPQTLAAFYELHLTLPNREPFRLWVAACDIRMQDLSVKRWGDWLDDAEQLLVEQGYPEPIKRSAKRPGFEVVVPEGGIEGAPTRTATREAETKNDEDRCITGLWVWLSGLHASDKRTRTEYLAWRRGTRWPAPSKFDDYGGFTELSAKAEAKLREEGPAGPDVTP